MMKGAIQPRPIRTKTTSLRTYLPPRATENLLPMTRDILDTRQRNALSTEVRKKHSHLTGGKIPLLLLRLSFFCFVSARCSALVEDKKKQFE